jgi:hypothetical protein
MMAATPTKLSSEADVGRSKAQHVVILAFCSKIAGITYSASPNTALDPRLGAKTGLNDEVFVNKLTASVPNGKCQIQEIAMTLNSTPRKSLAFKPPIEAKFGNDVQIRLA